MAVRFTAAVVCARELERASHRAAIACEHLVFDKEPFNAAKE